MMAVKVGILSMQRKKIELEELKSIELDMVVWLDKVCRENNLRYFLTGGSLLGAIRHKGFIPWDDDIDIGMPREDFYKFRNIVNSNNSYYRVAFYDTDKDYGYSIPKLLDTRTTLIDYKLGKGQETLSVFVDIFIFDGMGQRKSIAFVWYWFLKILKRSVYLSRRNFKMESGLKTIIFALPWMICKVIGTGHLNSCFNRLAGLKKFNNCQFVATASGVYGKREIFSKDVFKDLTEVEFEGIPLYAPTGYSDYLASLYGDYMKLPPKDKQISNHMSDEWWNG